MSQVVLKKFRSNQRLCVYDRSKDRVFMAGPRAVFKLPNFIAYETREAENRWGLVETQIPEAYRALEARTALADPVIVDILRDVLAVHWARSPATRAVHEQVGRDVIQESRLRYAKEPELLGMVFRARTGGLHPAGAGSLMWANEELHRIAPNVLERTWAERNAAHYEAARAYFATLQIQVGYADGADFLIGDAPVVTRKRGHTGLGPHQDVPLMEAEEVSMPVSPNIIIGLAREPAIVTLGPEQVSHFNRLQAASFIRFIGCRPGGSSELQLREALRTRSAHVDARNA